MLFRIIDVLFQVYTLLLFVRIIGSWFPELQRHRLMSFVAFYTDPYLNFFRRLLPPIGMMDFSPLLAFISLGIMEQIIKAFLAMMLR